jgi:hypothetical protein
MWDSVFWNEDNYRPDKTTKTLNEILKKLDTETQKKLVDIFQTEEKQSEIIKQLTSKDKRGEEQHLNVNVNQKWELAKNYSDEEHKNLDHQGRKNHSNFNSNSWTGVDRIISEILANNSDGSSRVEILKEEVEVLLQESKNHVQWDGEKFVPKPIQLSRINLAKFRDSQSFQDRTVRVRYTTAELSVPIKILEHAELNVVINDEWKKLKDEIKGFF